MRSLSRIPWFILSLVGVVLMLPALVHGPGTTHSHLYNYLWTGHFGEQMAAGHMYERWLPLSFEGLGSPTFYFYPPFAYWVTGAFAALGFSIQTAIVLGSLLLLVASGLAMHAWLRACGTWPLLGAALYMAAPYHLHDFYVRGALAEAAAFIWLPLIALGIMRLPERRGVALLGCAYAAMILSHLPLSVLTGLFLIAPLMAYRVWQDRATLLPGAAAGVLALGLSAFYLLPAATLQNHVAINLLWTQACQAANWSIWDASFELFPCLALGLVLLAWSGRSIWSALTAITALAAVGLIPFLWHIDLLNKVQFPWRLLAVTEFCCVTALMVGPPKRPLIVAGAVMLAFPYALTGLIGYDLLREPIDYALLDRGAVPDAIEYLPAGLDPMPVDPRDRSLDLSGFRKLPRTDTIVTHEAGQISFGRAAFPIWQVKRNGQPVATSGALVTAHGPAGTYRIERITIWQERWGAIISLCAALALLLVLGVPHIRHLSKFLTYSPFPSMGDWPLVGRRGRSQPGGEI